MKGGGKWALLTWAGNLLLAWGRREGSHLVLVDPRSAHFQMGRGPTCHKHLALTIIVPQDPQHQRGLGL